MRTLVRICRGRVVRTWRIRRKNVGIAQDLKDVIHADAEKDVLEHIEIRHFAIHTRVRPGRRARGLHESLESQASCRSCDDRVTL